MGHVATPHLAAGFLAALLVGACTAPPDPAATRQRLMQADLDFARATAERGAEGWAAWFAEEGRQFTARGTIEGRAAIRAHMAPVFADTNFRLDWHPTAAEAAASGDLGWTVGRWDASQRRPDGSREVTGSGNYVTLWKRQADGSWKVALDIGNSDPPASDPAHE